MNLIALDPPAPGEHVYEPHIAVDPANADRIAVVAQYGVRGGRAARRLQLWVSEDGGDSWFSRRVPRPKLDEQFTADPLVAFDEEGAVLVVGDCARWEIADANDALSFSRDTLPPFAQVSAGWDVLNAIPDVLDTASIGVSRSDDGGRTLTATAMQGLSPGADKSTIAVDRHRSSPYRGSVYVAWTDKLPATQIARSRDGGRTFEQPVLVHGPLPTFSQLAVRPDGTVHLLWHPQSAPGLPLSPEEVVAMTRTRTPGADAAQLTGVFHAVSRDGGATFSEPAVVGRHAGPGLVGIPALAADPDGRLLLVWGQTDAVPDPNARPVRQARHRLVGMHSTNGATWSSPAELCRWLPPGTHVGLPTLISDGAAWWLLAYLADEHDTRVVLLRSEDGLSFDIAHTLAVRPVPADEMSLMGSYLLRFCDQDTPQPGDYCGIAAAGSRVVAAFVLPETEVPTSRSTVYVGFVDGGRP
jgi:hypothetical protein